MATDYLDELRKTAATDPGRLVRVIVRLGREPAELEAQLTARGIRVQRVFRLTYAVAAEGTVSAVLALSAEGWVDAVEEDQEVRAGDDAE